MFCRTGRLSKSRDLDRVRYIFLWGWVSSSDSSALFNLRVPHGLNIFIIKLFNLESISLAHDLRREQSWGLVSSDRRQQASSTFTIQRPSALSLLAPFTLDILSHFQSHLLSVGQSWYSKRPATFLLAQPGCVLYCPPSEDRLARYFLWLLDKFIPVNLRSGHSVHWGLSEDVFLFFWLLFKA